MQYKAETSKYEPILTKKVVVPSCRPLGKGRAARERGGGGWRGARRCEGGAGTFTQKLLAWVHRRTVYSLSKCRLQVSQGVFVNSRLVLLILSACVNGWCMNRASDKEVVLIHRHSQLQKRPANVPTAKSNSVISTVNRKPARKHESNSCGFPERAFPENL